MHQLNEFVLSICFLLVRLTESIPRTLGVRQGYTQKGTPVYLWASKQILESIIQLAA